jgi:ketosteroid isomerase-like protein
MTTTGGTQRESGTGGVNAAEKIVRGVFAAWELGDLDAYLQLVHPDARLISVQAWDSVVLTPEDLHAALERARAEDFLVVSLGHIRSLDEVAVVAHGSLQRRVQPRGLTLSQYVWLFTMLDQLVFRIRPFATEQEARAAYERLGLTLGI